MSDSNVVDLTELRRERDFAHSWQRLLTTGRHIIALATSRQWQHAHTLFNERTRLSREHFSRYPLGPQHKTRYQHRLAELFLLEQEINQLMLFEQRKSAGKAPVLKRVK